MKLTLFIGGLQGGGAERVVCSLVNYLSQKGHQIEIVTMSENTPVTPLDERIKRISLLHEHERTNLIHNYYLRFSRLKNYMKESDTEGYVVMLPVTILILLGMRRYTKAPIIVSERCDPMKLSKGMQFFSKVLAKRASGFVFQTQDAKKWYEPYIGNIPAVVIPNAINAEFLYDRRTIEKREKKITAVGRLVQQKNFKLLLNAFAMLRQDYPDYRLVIYGEGPQRGELEALAREKGISDSVELPGWVSDIGGKIYDSSAFVLSSDYEGMPNALMEAMALGVPCIATDCPVGGPRFLIEDGKNGLLVPVGDAAALANAVRRLLSDENYAAGLGRRAREIKERLAPEKIYGAWEGFITSICEGQKHENFND